MSKEKVRIKTKLNRRSISNRDTPINMQKLKKKYINDKRNNLLMSVNCNQNLQGEVNYAEEQVENYTRNTLNYINSTLDGVIEKHTQRSSTLNNRFKQKSENNYNSIPKTEIEHVKKSLIPQRRNELYRQKIKQNYETQVIYQKVYYIKNKSKNIKQERKSRRIRSNKDNKVVYYLSLKNQDTINQSNKELIVHKEQTRNYIKQNESKRAKDIKSKQSSYIKQKEDIPNKVKEHEIVQTRMKENYKKNVKLKSNKTKHTISKTEKAKKIGAIIFTKAKSGALKSILAVGCSLVVIIVLIIVMISAFLQSSIGFLFADDSVDYEIDDISIGEARDILEQELDEKVEEIKADVDYDKLLIYAMEPNWKDILSTYAVLGSNRENIDVTSMKEENLEFLRKVFWECCEIEWDTSTYTVKHIYTVDGERVEEYEDRTKLEITLKKTWLDEMIGKYSLSNKEHEQLIELQKPEYEEMWARLLAVG